MSIAKIRIKLGALELEYEGEPAFLTDGLPDLLERVSSLSDQVAPPVDETNASGTHQTAALPEMSPLGEKVMTLTSNSVAARLDVKSGADLIICALATLEIFGGKAGVSKKEIQTEMKQAKSYFQAGHINNFGKNMATALKAKKINQLGADSYALSAAERRQLEARLADAE
ncbi:hypothetical protein [Shinella sumterensis]|uniref:hypothetical protein n=1 Tax=Shinella sumterensis TaxID=1967501 RepID=UPI003F87C117